MQQKKQQSSTLSKLAIKPVGDTNNNGNNKEQQQQHQRLPNIAVVATNGSSSIGSETDRSSSSSTRTTATATTTTTTHYQLDERAKACGTLFERKPVINQEIFDEFFRREPCLYNETTYKNAARIFHCLKANLNENQILKSLKQSQQQQDNTNGVNGNAHENGSDNNTVTEVPKIYYSNMAEKKKTLELAFSTLRFQKVLEDLLDNCQFYGYYPQFKDEQSLVCTILFDYMKRKFQLREGVSDTPSLPQSSDDGTNKDTEELTTQIELAIFKEKTDLAAELAKNRIRADALTLEQLLPKEIREVEQHRAELPLYCWVNPIRCAGSNSSGNDSSESVREVCDELIANDDLKLVECKGQLDRKCFFVDSHCPNLLMFHYALRDKIVNHDLIKTGKLVIQDKSSCLAPYSVVKLLSKKDDVIVTNVSGGLVAAYIGCQMEEFEGKVYVYGVINEDKYQELMAKFHQLGCSKYVKLMKEDFLNSKLEDSRLENVKVILINAPCSKTALMNPMEFLFQEGEDVRLLRDYTLDVNNPNKIKKCIQDENALLRHAFRFPKIRAVVYQTYSKNGAENESIVNKQLDDFNASRRTLVYPYKISPPVIPLTAEDIQNDEVVKDIKFLQFKPSNKMNGCFIALLTRDRDSNIDKEIQQQKKAAAAAAAATKKQQSTTIPATFEEKNFLSINKPVLMSGSPRNRRKSLILRKQPLTNLRRKSLLMKKSQNPLLLPTASATVTTSLEHEIQQLQMRHSHQLDYMLVDSNRLASSPRLFAKSSSIEPISFKSSVSSAHSSSQPLLHQQQQQQQRGSNHFMHNFENRLASIGKLDSTVPNRSSTPDDETTLGRRFKSPSTPNSK